MKNYTRDGYNYIADDGRIIYRVQNKWKGTTRWQVDDDPTLYRSLSEAYMELDFGAIQMNKDWQRVENFVGEYQRRTTL